MAAPLILIIDDDTQLTRRLALYFENNGYRAQSANSIEDAKHLIRTNLPDLIVLDWNLPQKDGLGFLGQWRATESRIPILMLSGNVSAQHRITGLRAGADDYVTKPFDVNELAARVDALLRRSRALVQPAPSIARFGPYQFDIDAARLTKAGQQVNLAIGELQLMSILCRNINKVLSRERLLEMIGDMHGERLDRSIDLRVARLRARLGDNAKSPQWIVTVRGQGYRLDGEISVA